ncbi:class I SAM-dependent DNA methyltransferase [Xylanibacillus composti]|uniref:Methyltransferase n=1 Tax=Xylanibacillus composti TaxID=1572762 RepID=A0A8J4H1P0_9BACL|nr:class I SAM-dependent methyltransferase [Xylanibacillus composti]GIQ67797.1 methyltransferase [Xylanibacillus composti]
MNRSADQQIGGNNYDVYDHYAWFWNKYWGRTSARKVLPIVKNRLLKDLPRGSLVMDVCCGTGQLLKLIEREGFASIGIDGSHEMIRYAQMNCPQGQFHVQDIRLPMNTSQKIDAACSFFDSLNHIVDFADLKAVFKNISDRMVQHGKFLFDLNMEAGYLERWNDKVFHIIQPDHVCIDRMAYDPNSRIGTNNVTLFAFRNHWERMDITIVEKCYTQPEIIEALESANFHDIHFYEAEKEFGFKDEKGRYYIICTKQ